MSSMAKIRPLLEQIVNRGEDDMVDPLIWQAAYEHIHGTDITADAITLAIAEFRADRLTRAAPNSTDDMIGGGGK